MEVDKDIMSQRSISIAKFQRSQCQLFDFCIIYLSVFCSYSLASGVCFLVMTDKTFSKRSAFSYLEDIQNEFTTNYGGHVPTARRPYCFIEFGENFMNHFLL